MEWIRHPDIVDLALEVDAENQAQFGPCSCCGQMTSRVWGYAYRGDAALAAYFVEWTPGHPNREASFDLILGRWGGEAEATDRKAVSLAFRHLGTGPAFMIQDAQARPVGTSSLVSMALRREQVLGTALAKDAFAVCDLVYLAHPRLEELRIDGV